jgi:hypothetical protein
MLLLQTEDEEGNGLNGLKDKDKEILSLGLMN